MKKVILLSSFFISCLSLIAQDPTSIPSADPTPRSSEPRSPKSSASVASENRIFTGGDFGMQFGSQTYIQIAPLIGYRLTEDFSAGITGKYIYYNLKNSNYNYKTNIYGGGIFTRYNILEEIFLHAEFEALSLEVPTSVYEINRRIVSGLFLGAGYRQFIGEFSSLNLMILFDVIEDKYSPYQNPQIRIGFDFGL